MIAINRQITLQFSHVKLKLQSQEHDIFSANDSTVIYCVWLWYCGFLIYCAPYGERYSKQKNGHIKDNPGLFGLIEIESMLHVLISLDLIR